jgi:ATP-binding cassette subfamily B protein
MEEILSLPVSIRDIIGDNCVHIQETDFTKEKKFGAGYLVLTHQELISISASELVAKIPLCEIKSVRADELVGGGRIIVETLSGLHELLHYSNHFVPHFSKTVKLIEQYLQTQTIGSSEELPSPFCIRCRYPLPDVEDKCPRCVPRLKIFKRIISMAASYRIKIFYLMVVIALGVIFQVLPPYITKKIVDDVIQNGNSGRLIYYFVGMILTGVFYLVMRLIHIRLASAISAGIVTELRSRLHKALQYLKLGFFTRREPGEIVSRIMHDTEELQHFLVEGLPYLIVNVLTFFVVGCILFSINWGLTLFVIIPLPLLVLGSGWFWKKLYPLFLREGTLTGHLHSVLSESLNGLRVVKACSKESHRIKIFDSANSALAGIKVTTQRVSGSFNEVVYWIMSLGVAFIWFQAPLIIASKTSNFTLGDLLAFVGYIWMFYGPLQWFSVVLNWMTQAFSGAERIFEILDTDHEVPVSVNSVTLPKIIGKIEFKDVHFGYERGKEVIKGVSFSIAPGEIIGLIGRSGAGKSTIINLLSRFYEVNSGEILIDGYSIDKKDISQIREKMGIVMQESFIFNASIAENIAYGIKKATFSDIFDAAKAD